MSDSNSAGGRSITSLIFVPAVITLAITILRLVGELEGWPSPWFNATAGGGGAVVGVSWLPLFFGPYFAMKLAGAGTGPTSPGKAIGFAALGLIVFVGGGFWFGQTVQHPGIPSLLAMLVMLAAAFIPGRAWSSLGNTLIAYAFAARIPVLIVMFAAMRGNEGQGWKTHYDVVPPSFQGGFWAKFIDFALLPQMTLWIGFTVVVGALVGSVVVAIARRGRATAQAAS